MFRLLAFDLDDTLLLPTGEISARAVSALNELNRRGVRIALCSGRMLPTMLPIAEKLDFAPSLVSYNGAQVNLSSEHPPLYHRPLPVGLADRVLDLARDRQLFLNYYYDNRLFVPELDSWKARYYREQTGAILEVEPNFERFRGMEPTKLIVIDEAERILDLQCECETIFQGELTLTRSKPIYLEFLHPEVDKGRGFEALCAALEIPLEDTAAFGDAPNDLQMLSAAGTAFAVGNAVPEVRAIADRIIGTNEEEGVAQILEEILTAMDRNISPTEENSAWPTAPATSCS